MSLWWDSCYKMAVDAELVSVPTNSMGIALPLIVVTAVLCALYYWQQSTRKFQLGNKLPGPRSLPFIGNTFDAIFCRDPYAITTKLLKRSKPYSKLAKIWFGPKLIVALMEPDDAELILNSNVHLKKSTEYRFFKPWLGDGLLISHGEKWRSHRKMIAPTFHMNILKSFMGVFNKNSRQVVDAMRSEVGKEFDVHDYMSGTTVDILLETAMGITKTDHNKAGFDYAMAEDFINIIHGLTKKVIKERKGEYINNKKSGDTQTLLEKVTYDVEETERKEKLSDTKSSASYTGLRDDLDDIDDNDVGQKKRLAFLDFMIEAGQNTTNISDTDIKEEVDTIMFEVQLLAMIQQLLVQVSSFVCLEYIKIFKKKFSDVTEMKYLERVILETLRLYPPVPVIARIIEEELQLVTDNLILPAGTTVIIPQFMIHRKPEFYPNPTKFDPDNFLPERCQNRHYYAYIPFSAGPRSCVGK
ncbi:Cytochrome P450 4g15 [Carabus blaptoides fortunei]